MCEDTKVVVVGDGMLLRRSLHRCHHVTNCLHCHVITCELQLQVPQDADHVMSNFGVLHDFELGASWREQKTLVSRDAQASLSHATFSAASVFMSNPS